MFVHGLHLWLAEADRTHLLRAQTLAMRHQLTRGEAGACNMVMITLGVTLDMMTLGVTLVTITWPAHPVTPGLRHHEGEGPGPLVT